MARPEDNNVPYRSPVEVGEADIASTQDEEDFSTLIKVLQDINEAKDKCSSMSALNLDDPKLTTDQQVFAYQFALNELILPLEETVKSTIGDVKLKQLEAKGKK